MNPVVRVLRGGLRLRQGWGNRRTVQPERPCKAYPTTIVAKLDSKERKRGSEDGSRLPGWVLSLHSLLLKKKILFGGNDGFRFLLSGNFPHSFVAVFKLLLRGNSNFKVPNQRAHVNFIFVCVCVCIYIYIYIK